MTLEEKRKFLKAYRYHLHMCETWNDRMAELKQALLPSGIDYSSEPVKSSKGDRMAKYMARLYDMAVEHERHAEAVFEAQRALETIENTKHRLVVHMHYIEGMTYREIGRKLNYAEVWVKEMSRQGVEAMHVRSVLKSGFNVV